MSIYPAYHIRHSNPTMLVSSTSCFFPYLPVLTSRGLSQHSVLSCPNQNLHFGFICGETAELEGREYIINTLPHLSRHSKRNSWETVVLGRGALEEGEKVWYYQAVRIHMESRKEWVRSTDGKDRVCNLLCNKIGWYEIQDAIQTIYPRVSQIYTPRYTIHLRYLCIPVCPHCPFRLQHPCISVHPP